jgi:hypothetical protein
MPSIRKYGKDIASLIVLVKDKTLEDDVAKYKKDSFKDNKFSLSAHTSYSYSKSKTILNSYDVHTSHAVHTDIESSNLEITLIYNVKTKQYSTRIVTDQTKLLLCIKTIKDSEKTLRHMSLVLTEWMDKNEALDVKNSHIEKLQESMQIKCSL